MGDVVDELLDQWAEERPDLDLTPLAVLTRVTRLARLLDRAQRDFLAAHRLEPGEFDVLTTLRRAGGERGLTAGAFLTSSLVTAGAITNRLDRMTAKGLIRRTPERKDRRVVRVSLTPAGRDLVDALLTEHAAHCADLLSPLPPQTRELVADALSRLLQAHE
ncbi:MarR family winged helix-turn-helix transcriptional regulator [Actinosynnema mirum]|uniref:Transcriptional regulator, MarR family n=1 Tax=Actinosynnema mirum (strain ATCC 29888 / DSM 43827 / JCM 3225 / NBRC 14064 / NCIMB 13271 / NRRL B-12336 / IMRU 3971 / 101) TaxID=446462 RepID=C6WAT6_ACTMD|nr:MarR family transcriptional regulator [Actinosynnema mirum]ACU37405.1 transcriptional regulator, MarR family [Actinosynnema mirum DSM 43827]